MSKKPVIIPKKPTHLLLIKDDQREVTAFTANNERSKLRQGKYPCAYTDNPYNFDEKALCLIEFRPVMYVRVPLLEDDIDPIHWSIVQIDGKK